MQTKQTNLNEWLRIEAHITSGNPFQMEDCSCVPVTFENQKENEPPLGFLMTHGTDISFVLADSPEGGQFLNAWNKLRVLESIIEDVGLPTEYWYG